MPSVVDARCDNTNTDFPFDDAECAQLVGQRVRLTGPNLDRSRTYGWVTVDEAKIDGDDVALRLLVDSPYSGVLSSGEDKPVRVAIGYERRASGEIVLREVAPDSTPVLIVPPKPGDVTAGARLTGVVTSAAVVGSRIGPIVSKYETEAECEQHGGHCWERTGMTRASVPPQHEEACKHCPAKRYAIPRTPFTYRYPDGREE